MVCEQCGRVPATVHLTRIVNGEKTEVRLCEQCARERGDFEFLVEPKFSLQNLLAGLLDHGTGLTPLAVPADVACDLCGLRYSEFARTGKLGCGHCYREFDEKLEPLLRRIHGSGTHRGKVPRRTGEMARARRELDELRGQLRRCIEREDFERAAVIRDRIRVLEKKQRPEGPEPPGD